MLRTARLWREWVHTQTYTGGGVGTLTCWGCSSRPPCSPCRDRVVSGLSFGGIGCGRSAVAVRPTARTCPWTRPAVDPPRVRPCTRTSTIQPACTHLSAEHPGWGGGRWSAMERNILLSTTVDDDNDERSDSGYKNLNFHLPNCQNILYEPTPLKLPILAPIGHMHSLFPHAPLWRRPSTQFSSGPSFVVVGKVLCGVRGVTRSGGE